MALLDQVQNEALIRLMILAKYQDQSLSLLEDETFRAGVEALDWTSGIDSEYFINDAFSRVRQALSTQDGRSRFLREQCACFDTPEKKAYAMQQVVVLIEVDGVDGGEPEFLQTLRQLLQ